MLRIAYDLPFTVSHPVKPFLSTGQEVIVVMRLREGSTSADVDRIAGLMALFARFANTGGLAGQTIEPWRSGLVAHAPAPPRGNELSFRWERCLVDDASLVVLATMFLRKEVAPLVEAIVVHASGANQKLVSDPSGHSTYPQRFERAPFPIIDEEPESGAYTFALGLESPLDEKNRPALAEAFSAWTAFILAGGFALAPIPPDETYVEPDDPFVDFDATVEWSIFKLRADPAGVDALLGAICAFHHRQQHLHTLTIS